jgi:hypothetical protein
MTAVKMKDFANSLLSWRVRQREESFGTVESTHYVFAAFVPKFTSSGKKVID